MIRQADVPGRLFSATGNGGTAAAEEGAARAEGAEVTEPDRAGPDPADPPDPANPPLHAAVVSATARAAARSAARRFGTLFVMTRLTDLMMAPRGARLGSKRGSTSRFRRASLDETPSLPSWLTRWA